MENNSGISVSEDFVKEVECNYKDEKYSVRDNGAVLKHSRAGMRIRPTDSVWTFGKANDKTGYMEIASVRLHRVIATAFHGVPPNIEYVVDHIDTNKQNNRPENLRWVTRLENILLNPITAKRIAYICGSVEEFLADPSKFRDKFFDPNYHWMCTVSSEEAKTTLDRMLAWAGSDKTASGGSLGYWIYSRSLPNEIDYSKPDDLVISALTPNAAQRKWTVPSEFPSCPQEHIGEPLSAYAANLHPGSVFCQNDIYSSVVSKFALSKDLKNLYIVTNSEGGIKGWALAKITFEDNVFMHTSLGTFFEEVGAEKYFTIAQGLEWHGGEVFDDNC